MGFGIAKHGAARVDQVESLRAKAMDTKATAHTTLTRALGSTAPVSLLNPQLHPKAPCRPEGGRPRSRQGVHSGLGKRSAVWPRPAENEQWHVDMHIMHTWTPIYISVSKCTYRYVSTYMHYRHAYVRTFIQTTMYKAMQLLLCYAVLCYIVLVL